MTTALKRTGATAPVEIERVLIEGDLSRLTPDQKITYYLRVCESLSLNPYTKPFDYLKLNGREILYARKDATDQLRKVQHVSITHLARERLDDLYVVTAAAKTPDGRTDSAIGAVMVKGLAGEALANALMKAETKAKRRVTLSICGLGITDDSEVDSIPGAQRAGFNGPIFTPDELGGSIDDDGRMLVIPANVDVQTGEVVAEEQPSSITSVDSQQYQAYAALVERAAAVEVEYDVPELPMSETALRDLYRDLLGRVKFMESLKQEPAAV